MKVAEGYSMADSRNLPKVDLMMLLQYMREHDEYNVAEIRGAKVLMSSRDSYVETAVGFVQVKRESNLCTVKCQVTPEHKVRAKPYIVFAIVNEIDETIVEAECQDCAASAAGCKHTICLLAWLVRRTEEPAVTSVTCYWARPKLSEAVTKDKFVLAKEMGQKRPNLIPAIVTPSLNAFVDECRKRKVENVLLLNYQQPKQSLDKFSMFDIILEYNTSLNGEEGNFPSLKNYAENIITAEVRQNIEKGTRFQAQSNLWHTLRQGRVTASKIQEAVNCKKDGVLVKSILGGYKVPETKAIKRGKKLECLVIKQLEVTLNIKIKKCGFFLITPFIGASPDGICDDFIIEIKCPFTEKAVSNYVKNNIINDKYKAQCQLQMHAAGKKKALFCVADPQFETNQKYSPYWLYYDQLYIKKLLLEGEKFWEKYIFEKMLDITKTV